MTLNELASAIAKREGKKHQASIGDLRETLSIMVDMEIERVEIGDSPSFILTAAALKKQKMRICVRRRKK